MGLAIGITGGIGSGKTTVCRLFEILGVPVYYADDRAKSIMIEDLELMNSLKQAFGQDIYSVDGQLERKKLASIVFNDPEALNRLNNLVHPAVFRDSANWTDARAHLPYTIKEAALLFESGSWQLLDEIIFVDAPEDIRIQRVVNRDGSTEEEVRARIEAQMPDSEKRERSQHVILNDGSQSIIHQVIRIHQDLSARGQAQNLSAADADKVAD